jgi:hypothetical protein
MVDQLHDIMVGIFTVKASRAIPVGARRCLDRYLMAGQKPVPDIDLLWGIDDKAYVIETLRTAVHALPYYAVQGEIVISGR